MIGGVGFPSVLDQAVISTTSAMDANYPITNLSDLDSPNRGARRSSTGTFQIRFVFPVAVSLQFLALINHNIPDGTVRVRVWAGTDTGVAAVYDSGSVLVWPAGSAPVANYLSTRPVVMPSPVSGRTVYVDLTPTTATAVQVGGVDLGGWWSWPDISVDEERGFESSTIISQQPGGLDAVTRQWAPRTMSGRREALTSDELQTTALDFQMTVGKSRPFVFVRDVADASRWARETFLAKNIDLPTMPVDDTDVGAFNYRLREHIG